MCTLITVGRIHFHATLATISIMFHSLKLSFFFSLQSSISKWTRNLYIRIILIDYKYIIIVDLILCIIRCLLHLSCWFHSILTILWINTALILSLFLNLSLWTLRLLFSISVIVTIYKISLRISLNINQLIR